MRGPEGLRNRRGWWAAAGVLVLAGIMAWLIPAEDWSEALQRTLDGRDLAMALLVFCGAYVVGTMLLVPAWIFPIVAGAAFGLGWGVAASVVSSVLSATGAFLLARYVLRDSVERAARRNEAFAAVSRAVDREPLKVIALLRLSPVLPSGLKSYFLGLVRVGLAPYALASAAGMLPGIVLKVYVGYAGRGVLDDGGPLKWAMLAAGVVATVAMALVVGRAMRRKLGL